MCSTSSKVFILCALFYFVTGFNIRDEKNSTDSASPANVSETGDLDDRFNINFSSAQAQGFGRLGGHSQSNALSYGVNAGIRGPGGQYQNLFSKTGSQSQGFSTGPGAPLTFANTGSRVRPGHAGGNAAAGVLGGRGSSYATSQNQNIEIPLDNYGTVLLSNLKAPTNSSSKSSQPKSNEPAPLVFA